MRMHFVQTYDLSTQLGKMGIVGVHTPFTASVARMFPGFFENFKRWRPKKCNIAMACASMLPADPLQIGVETGSIAPQDMFNPILYRAVTNDSFNVILSRVYNRVTGNSLPTSPVSFGADVVDLEDPFAGLADVDYEKMYYGLLSSQGWRKSMPQSGLRMAGLRPLVYNVISNFGNNTGALNSTPPADISSNNTAIIAQGGTGSTLGKTSTLMGYMRGKAFPLPSIPTRVLGSNTTATATASSDTDNIPYPFLNPSYVALLVLPPAKLNRLFYRLRIDWEIEFSDPCSAVDMSMPTALQNTGAFMYFNTYDQASKDIQNKGETVDTNDTDIKMIMESDR